MNDPRSGRRETGSPNPPPPWSVRLAFADLLREARQLARALVRRLSWFVRRRARGLDRRIVRSYLQGNAPQKLHLGCGLNVLDGWLNSDLFPLRPFVLHLDVRLRFPLADECLDYVYSEHLIEHLPLSGGAHMLSECHRVLRAGGRIRIATPDVRFLFALSRDGSSALEQEYVRWATALYFPSAPAPDPILVINNFFRNWGHRFLYDEAILRRALERAGFVDVVRVDLGESAHPHFRALENESRLPPGFLRLETMVFEAVKPPAEGA